MTTELWLRIDDPIDGERVVCLSEEAVLGRDFRCDVVIHDEEASRMHARMSPVGPQAWQLADLTTTNGTFVNTARIVGPAEIGVGDVIRVGRVSCTVIPAPPL